MKFIKKKSLLNKVISAGELVSKNWGKLSEDKRQEICSLTWNGIIPNNLPRHLQPFKKQLQAVATQGSEGPAWDKVIEDTKTFIQDSKTLSKTDLFAKHKLFLEKLEKVNYKDYAWMTPEERSFNIQARQAIKFKDLFFIEKNILPDLIESKNKAWLRHYLKFFPESGKKA